MSSSSSQDHTMLDSVNLVSPNLGDMYLLRVYCPYVGSAQEKEPDWLSILTNADSLYIVTQKVTF